MEQNVTFTAKSEPGCKSFLKIKWPDEEYLEIDNFIKVHPSATLDELYQCSIWYRGCEKTYREVLDEYVSFSRALRFLEFNTFRICISSTIRASIFFIEKAGDCLQDARYFTIKSALLLDTNENLPWQYGYTLHYSMRCTHFGTAVTWYSNAFDQILQAVYWAYELYTGAKDHDQRPYNDNWNVKKLLSLCTYKFVMCELRKRGLDEVRTLLATCYETINEVRGWANHIKHKGGIEYKYLKPEPPFKVYFIPKEAKESDTRVSFDRFSLEFFKSPIAIDIDEKIGELEITHKALLECINGVASAIDFDKYELKVGV